MSIKYQPDTYLRKIASKKRIKNLINKKNGSLKRTALSFVDSFEFLDKKEVTKTALNVINDYKKRAAALDMKTGSRKAGDDLLKKLERDPKQLLQRVQNSVLFQISQDIKSKYAGQTYTWLPSESEEPDPEHQLNYGKVFVVGEGELPGERYGCKCGMEIHTDDTKLEL